MNPKEIIRGILIWLFYVLLHVFVARYLVLFDYAFCFVYVGAILFMPYDTNQSILLLIAFATGLIIDSFGNTLGVHTSVTVLLAYIRPFIVRNQLGQIISEARTHISLQNLGLVSFIKYVVLLVLIHHTVLLLIGTGTLSMFPITMLKIICSVVFTTFTLLLTQIFVR
jgi:hypothetical protein